jgi:hypothetical protein
MSYVIRRRAYDAAQLYIIAQEGAMLRTLTKVVRCAFFEVLDFPRRCDGLEIQALTCIGTNIRLWDGETCLCH